MEPILETYREMIKWYFDHRGALEMFLKDVNKTPDKLLAQQFISNLMTYSNKGDVTYFVEAAKAQQELERIHNYLK